MMDIPQIKKAVFHTSAKKGTEHPDSALPEIAVAGKSNVGKSSLINYLTNNSKLARVSKQPGKTRLVNYFTINEAFYLVDLPGYGFARVSKAERESWGSMMEGYFETADTLKGLLILMDIRHDPSADDVQMVCWADHFDVPYAIVATKADKIAKSKRINYARSIERYIQKEAGLDLKPQVLWVSALEKRGSEDVLAYIWSRLEEGV